MFPATIQESYQVVETKHGGGDSEATIPLGSWRKGDGLEGRKGHVYEYGPGWAGVWIKTAYPRAKMTELRSTFANLVPMQTGEGEGTFRVPVDDLDRLLPMLKAKKRFKASEGQLAAARKGQAASPIIPKSESTHRQRPSPPPSDAPPEELPGEP